MLVGDKTRPMDVPMPMSEGQCISINEKDIDGLEDCNVGEKYVIELVAELKRKDESKHDGLTNTFKVLNIKEIEDVKTEDEEEKVDKLKSKVSDHYR